MDDVRVDWKTATVSDGTLTVELAGEVAKEWKASFETTAKLLGSGTWDELRLKKGTVTVKGLSEGEEDKLRHHLEGIVTQANARVHAASEDGGDDGDEDEPEGPDAEMTERFRAFGEDSDDVDDGE